MKKEMQFIPEEVIVNKIYQIRGEKVMLDRDLAELYGVETIRDKFVEILQDSLKISCLN